MTLVSIGLTVGMMTGCGGSGNSGGDTDPLEPEIGAYIPINIESKCYGLTNNGTDITYATDRGELYTLNTNTGISTYLDDVGEQANGLAYQSTDIYFYSVIYDGINRLEVGTSITNIATVAFSDGLDFYQNKIYSVTSDASGILAVFNIDGEVIGTLDTGIDDITGITHSNDYLYILAESGDIYQTDTQSGESRIILMNDNLFESTNTDGGLEAITILDQYIYVSNTNENKIYKINININNFE